MWVINTVHVGCCLAICVPCSVTKGIESSYRMDFNPDELH